MTEEMPAVDESELPAEPRQPIEQIQQILEGAILAADHPLSIDQLLLLFPEDTPTRAEVREALAAVNEACDGRGFELKEVASGYRFQVRTEFAPWVGRLWDEKPPRYTRALLETLALIAYKQPITRGDIEEIRGVAVSTNIMRSLLEREWIRVVGHRDVPGRPAMYATTKTFLDYFNLTNLEELPTLSEIKDLDAVNEELNLNSDDDLIQLRSLELSEEEQEEVVGGETDLDEVTAQVNQIQDNIRNLFNPETEDDEQGESESSDEDDEVAASAESTAEDSDAGDNVEDDTTADAAEAPGEPGEAVDVDAAESEPGQAADSPDSDEADAHANTADRLASVLPPEIMDAAFADDDEPKDPV